MTTALAALLTAEEYGQLPDNGQPTELVRGRIVPLNMPYPRHGQICVQAAYLLRRFLDEYPLGHVVGNDSGVVTQTNPDTVRGADVAFYSFERVPPGPFPRGYLTVVPEIIFEVRSPTDRRGAMLTKVGEYLIAGVTAVCVLDQMTETARVFLSEDVDRAFAGEEVLMLPAPLQEFRVSVRRFFE